MREPTISMSPTRSYTIAVLPGDGIGVEVMPPALRCLEAASKVFGFHLEWRQYPWASCTYYHQHGKMLPDDWKQLLQACDAIYFGAGKSVSLRIALRGTEN
jgi:tartrate dehydrogenase/decarboxylase/D-malate dehydrogenase